MKTEISRDWIKFGYDWGLLDLNKTDSIQLRNSGWHIGAAFLF